MGHRTANALYQAWRCFQLVGTRSGAKVLEIGGGLGRTAYYAQRFGVAEYTIVDLPITGAAQAYFLGRTLGEETLRLLGETDVRPVSLLPPAEFFNSDVTYDLILNADSLTEMGRDTAQAYWEQIKARTSYFLSINHESNEYTVRGMFGPEQKSSRAPYWLRRGYVEELVAL